MDIQGMMLNTYEVSLAAEVLCADEIDTSFADIGGMEKELQEVKDNVILPLKVWHKVKHTGKKIPLPSGILLYGKPGTGKSLTARAIAKESGATFIPVKSSGINQKYIGEGEKMITAIFSLARKLAPSVIFLDEIDTMFGDRNKGENGNPYANKYLGSMLSEWDGLVDACTAPVLVLCASNRPQDLDKAFQRRLPMTVQMKEPNADGRKDILTKMLKGEELDVDVDLLNIAKKAKKFTGSDLRELVRVAKLEKMKSDWTDIENETSASVALKGKKLSNTHFEVALSKTNISGATATDYSKEQLLESARERKDIIDSVLKSLNADLPSFHNHKNATLHDDDDDEDIDSSGFASPDTLSTRSVRTAKSEIDDLEYPVPVD